MDAIRQADLGAGSRLTFGWESVRVLFAEPNLADLLRAHWEELAVTKEDCPLDPDFKRFVELEDLGIFKVWAARDGATLAGYLAWFIQPHLHYRSTLHAVEDLFLLSAPYRRGLAGYRMFTSVFDALRELSVRRCIVHEKVHYQRDRVEQKARGLIEALVHRAIAGDAEAIDDLVELFFAGNRTGLGIFFRRLGFVHTDNLLIKIL